MEPEEEMLYSPTYPFPSQNKDITFIDPNSNPSEHEK